MPKTSPYAALNNDYFRRPRWECVVDEINCLEGEACEVLVYPPCDREIDWMLGVMRGLGQPFAMEYTTEDRHGRSRFVFRQEASNDRLRPGRPGLPRLHAK